ncbi:MAG: hypothetical protein HY454_00410 [Parcubacteria group bacterium]|nr:hypothetical protein [Parcubacteria group bacterium]
MGKAGLDWRAGAGNEGLIWSGVAETLAAAGSLTAGEAGRLVGGVLATVPDSALPSALLGASPFLVAPRSPAMVRTL